MFCPRCSEPKANEATQFCTKCGFDLTDLQTFVESGGSNLKKSQRHNGMEQGVKLILLSVLMFPIYVFIGPFFPANDVLVESGISTTWFEQISWTLIWVTFLAGVARLIFAFIFERGVDKTAFRDDAARSFESNRKKAALPDSDSFQAANPGRWKTTDELFEPVLRKPKASGELR